MDQGRVIEVVRALHGVGVRFWLVGGWGIDALLGRQTRAHADLDLSFLAPDEARALATLGAMGFTEVLDQRPTRFVLRDAARREIDMHPVVETAGADLVQTLFDGGSLWYPAADLVYGTVGDVVVPSISARLQIAFHQGYVHLDKDVADLAHLRQVAPSDPGVEIGSPRSKSSAP